MEKRERRRRSVPWHACMHAGRSQRKKRKEIKVEAKSKEKRMAFLFHASQHVC